MTFLQIPFFDNNDAATDSIAARKAEAWSALKSMSFDDLISRLAHSIVEFAISLCIAVIVFYVGKFIIRKIYQLVSAVMIRRQIDRSLSTFILSLIRIVLYFILIVTVIGILGINTSSFIAIFASVGVAIGMALSGTLQNFAGGVLILLLKPYKIGDYIEAQGFAGTVTEIQIFSTIISTPDNKSILIPNGQLSTGSINNWSREDYRRVDWTVSLSYGDDVAAARQAILAIIEQEPRVVKQYIEDDREERLEMNPEPEEPEPERHRSWLYRLFHRHRERVRSRIDTWEEKRNAKISQLIPKTDRSPSVNLNKLNDSSIDLVVRAWTRSSDYWGVYYSINEKIYSELPKQGFSFPFPQLDVHISSAEA